jgi:hypothetical protein
VLGLRIGLGQITQLRNRALSRGSLQSATYDGHPACKVNVAKAVNVTVLPLEDAPRGYHDFDKGAAKKFVLDLQGMVRSRRAGSALATAGV